MSELECRVERESFTDKEVRAMLATARSAAAAGMRWDAVKRLRQDGYEAAADIVDALPLRPGDGAEAAIRQNERERCRDRINALIEAHVAMSERHQTVPGRRWYEARLATLVAARSAVMRGDDDGAPPL